jgi:lysophospholipase L1-like esterase
MLAAALSAALLSACHPHATDRNGDGNVTLVCIGDSNTDKGPKPNSTKWCEFLGQLHPDWKTVNNGVSWAKAAGDCFFCGQTMVGSVLATTPADIIILALGTNDTQQQPEAVVDALLSLRERAARKKAEVFVATIPPVFPPYPGHEERMEHIKAANALLAQRVPPNRLVDFFSDMRREDFYPDGLHLTASGQRKRAAAAEQALKNL